MRQGQNSLKGDCMGSLLKDHYRLHLRSFDHGSYVALAAACMHSLDLDPGQLFALSFAAT